MLIMQRTIKDLTRAVFRKSATANRIETVRFLLADKTIDRPTMNMLNRYYNIDNTFTKAWTIPEIPNILLYQELTLGI
jgi:hypothetical protein